MTVEDQNVFPVVQSHPTFSDPLSETIADARPGPIGFVAIPSATAREDSVNEMWATDESESRAHGQAQLMTDSWKEDAKGVLIFVSPVQLIVAFLSYLPCCKDRYFICNRRIVYHRKL